MRNNRFLASAFLVLFFGGHLPVSAQTSWGDAQSSGVRESSSTGMFTQGRAAFDANVSTAWQLAPGSTSGWADRYWSQPQRLGGATVNSDLPAGVQLQVSILGGTNWVPVPGATVAGPFSGSAKFTFPGELPPTTRLLVTLTGALADQAKVWEVALQPNSAPVTYGKILPQSYTFNQTEYINLKASRLWDGVNGNSWFSPLWSLPQEVFQTDGPDKPTKIFPPYFGNPPHDGEIVWQLDASYVVKTLKAYFIQNYQSVEFEFWDGSHWTNAQVFGPGWNDSGSGWQRIDLKTPVATTKIRITFPGNWNRAGSIGELEVWGEGFAGTPPQALVISPLDSDGTAHFTWTASALQDEQLEVTIAGKTTAALTGEWNAAPLTANPATWIGGDTVYRVPLAKETLRPDTQFLKLFPPGTLHSVVIKNGTSRGQLDLGWPYGDGQFANTTAAPSTPIPVMKDKTWTWNVPYQLEKLRVYSAASNPGTFQASSKGHATPVSWTSQGAGWWEASLSGMVADQLIFHSPVAVTLDEVQVWGTPAVDTKVGMEIWWPQNKVVSPDSDSNSVIGWMGESSVQPLIGGYHPRQADKLFWMPLAEMGLTPGQSLPLTVQGVFGSASTVFEYQARWPGNNPVATLDQGTALAATAQSTLVLTGTLGRPNLRVFVQGIEIANVGSKFTASVPLKTGFQLISVEIWDKQKKHLQVQYTKPIYRAVGQPSLRFDLPPGDLWTQGNSLSLSGLVGNGLGLSLSLNGVSVPLVGDSWGQTTALKPGNQAMMFVLKDNAGRETNQTLNVNRDGAAPTVQFIFPNAGAYLKSSLVNLQIGGSDSQYWFSVNSGAWTPAYTQTVSWPAALADGFYTYTAVAEDRSGNVGPTATVSFCVDTTAPVDFTIVADVNGWTNNKQPTLTFATTDATSGIDHYEYAVDSGGFTLTSSPLKMPVLADGVHTVFVKAVDKAGNSNLENCTLSIDTQTPPTPTNLAATPGMSEIDLTWTGVSESGIFSTLPITYLIQRTPAWSDGGNRTSLAAGFTDTGLATGAAYAYKIIAVDLAGNQSLESPPVSAVVGLASAPINPSGPTTVNFNQVTVTLPANAASSGVVGIEINQLPLQYIIDQPSNALVSEVFQFRVRRSTNGDSVVSDHADFASPASVQITYDPAKIPAGMTAANLEPVYYDSLWGRWIPIDDAIVDLAHNRVIFQTNHFSDFSVQATKETQASPQQLTDVKFSPFASTTAHAPLNVSSQEAVVSTAFTEFKLPGKNGLDLTVKRVYSTAEAESDAGKRESGSDGADPWNLGPGWRLNFPFMKWDKNGLWITDLNGNTLSLGQMNFGASTGSSGTTQIITLENHFGSDARLQLTMQPHQHYTTEYTSVFGVKLWKDGRSASVEYVFESAKLQMKDGQEVDFDSQGRVVAVFDSPHVNKIAFTYSGNQASSITDSMGRLVSFDYVGKSIHKINVSSHGKNYDSSPVTYDYTDGNLTSATDIGLRKWAYLYDTKDLVVNTNISTPGYLQPPKKVTHVTVLTQISGPGIGIQKVTYTITDPHYSDSKDHVDYEVVQDRLLGSTVTTLTSSQVPVNTTNYVFSLASGGHHQFYVNQSTVSDSRSSKKTSFGFSANNVIALSTAEEALKDQFSVGSWPDKMQVVSYPSLVTSETALGSVWETTTETWDSSTMRLTEESRQRSPTNFSKVKYIYDFWGNVTSIVSDTAVGSYKTKVEDNYSYYNTQSTDLGLTWPDVSLVEPQLTFGQKSLIAAHRRLVSGWRPSSTQPEVVNEFADYTYNASGELVKKNEWTGATWATTSFQYNSDGEIVAEKGPLPLQETDYSYNYETAGPAQYSIASTAKGIALQTGDSGGQDLATINYYNYLDGTNVQTVDPAGNSITRVFDTLGRVTKITEPPTAAGKPATIIVYVDTPDSGARSISPVEPTGPYSVVTNPLGLATQYSFDSLGRMVNLYKKDTKTQEGIETRLTYDAWNNVTTVQGPVSSLELNGTLPTGRTFANQTTTYTYDYRGRVLSESLPGALEPKTNSYSDNANSVSARDEVGNVISTVLDWNDKPLSTTSYPAGQTVVVKTFYDGLGRVIATVDPNGNETDTFFNSQGLEASVVAPSRLVLEDAQTATIVPRTDKAYDSAGNLVAVAQPLAGGKQKKSVFQVNSLGQILQSSTGVTVGAMSRTLVVSNVFDQVGNKLSEATGYAGGTTATKKWTYDSHARRLTEVDENDRVTSYSYDIAGNRISVVDPRQGLYPGSFSLTLNYNEFNRLVSANLPGEDSNAAPTIHFLYDGCGNLLQRVDTDGQTTINRYSPRNLLLTETTTDGTTTYATQHAYDDSGRETTITSPSGHVTSKVYDAASRVVEIDENSLLWTQYVYDPAGNKTLVVDGNGNQTAYTYNPEGQILSTTDALSKVSSNSYDRWGNITQFVDAAGNTRTFGHDELGRETREVTPWGGIVSTTLDAWGKPISQKDARGTVFDRTYSLTHLLTSETATNGAQGLQRTFTYDEAGELKTAIDNGIVTTYNIFNGKYQPSPYNLVRAKSNTLQNIGSQSSRSVSMTFDYDSRQRLTGVTYPDSTSVTYSYNQLNQIVSMPGWIKDKTLFYDAAGRLSAFSSTNGVSKTYTYDSQDRINNLAFVARGVVLKEYALTYDGVGNIITKNNNTYGYDAINQLITSNEMGWFQKQPEDIQQAVSYTTQDQDYATINGVSMTGARVLSFQTAPQNPVGLDLASRSVGLDLGAVYGINQIKITPQKTTGIRVRQQDIRLYSSNSNNSTDGLTSDYTIVLGWTFTQNSDGSMTLKFPKIFTARYLKINTIWDDRDANDNSVDNATVYNNATELIKVWTSTVGQNERYTYDSIGNRTKQSMGGESVDGQSVTGNTSVYTYYQNSALTPGNLTWLATDSVWYYQYDLNGNLVTKAKALVGVNSANAAQMSSNAAPIDTTQDYWTYTWDLKNRLVAVLKKGSLVASYAYDADNLRVVRKTASGNTRVYAYGNNGALAWTEDLNTGVARTFAYLRDQAVGWIDSVMSTTTNTVLPGSQSHYYSTTDHLGSITEVTDDKGSEVWSSEYVPFGQVAGVQGPYDFDGSYAGHQPDVDTGLIYMNARWQDPALGRFISEDPAKDGINYYAYGSSNPMVLVDPTGLEPHTPGSADGYRETISQRNATAFLVAVGIAGYREHQSDVELRDRKAAAFKADPIGYATMNTDFQSGGLRALKPIDSGIEGLAEKHAQDMLVLQGLRNGKSWGEAQSTLGKPITASDILFHSLKDAIAENEYAGANALAIVAGSSRNLARPVGQATGEADAASPSASVWSLNPFARGKAIEQSLRMNLPGNFPTIDRFMNGAATSIKSLDLGAASYQSTSTLSGTVTGYINSVAGFNGARWAGVNIQGSQITSRGLDLAIPSAGNVAQQQVLQQMIQYGRSVGVNVNVRVFP